MYFSLILTFLLILGVTILAFQNSVPLEFRIFSWRFQTSLVAIVFASCLVGIFIGMVLTLPGLVKKHFRERKLAKMVRELERRATELEQRSSGLECDGSARGRDDLDALASDNWLK